jgi:hypothetical protein
MNRPDNVHPDVTHLGGGAVGCWQYCWLEEKPEKLFCQYIMPKGTVRYEEEFLPYDGGPLPREEELEFVHSGYGDAIRLSNGRYLLPSSRYEKVKKFIDRVEGQSDDDNEDP